MLKSTIKVTKNVSSRVNLWHYSQYDQQTLREPYSIQYPTPYNSTSSIDSSKSSEDGDGENSKPLKTKRRRTSSQQPVVLNNVFERTFFPSTQVWVDLARQLGMSPRTVQIWFQNKRQSMLSKQRPGSSPSHQMSLVEWHFVYYVDLYSSIIVFIQPFPTVRTNMVPSILLYIYFHFISIKKNTILFYNILFFYIHCWVERYINSLNYLGQSPLGRKGSV
jgi:hypothetical protein